MNKFATFAILALAALTVAAVHANPIPDVQEAEEGEAMTQAFIEKNTDLQETVLLYEEGLEVFKDFCLSSRDSLLTELKKQQDGLTQSAFNMFFNTAGQVGKETLGVQERATEKLANQLAHPEAPIDGATDNSVDQIIAEGQSEIAQGQSQPRALLTAFKSAVSAISSKVGSLVSERFEYLKSLASPQQLVNGIAAGCAQIATYEKDIRAQFEEYKQTSLGSDAEKYAKLKMDAVPCATSTKIIRSEGLCGLVRVVQEPVKKIMATRS